MKLPTYIHMFLPSKNYYEAKKSDQLLTKINRPLMHFTGWSILLTTLCLGGVLFGLQTGRLSRIAVGGFGLSLFCIGLSKQIDDFKKSQTDINVEIISKGE